MSDYDWNRPEGAGEPPHGEQNEESPVLRNEESAPAPMDLQDGGQSAEQMKEKEPAPMVGEEEITSFSPELPQEEVVPPALDLEPQQTDAVGEPEKIEEWDADEPTEEAAPVQEQPQNDTVPSDAAPVKTNQSVPQYNDSPQPPQYPPYPYQGYYQQPHHMNPPPRTYAPYGQMKHAPHGYEPQDKPPKSTSYRLFVGALVTLGAIFVFGFFSYGIYMALLPAVQPPVASQPAPEESGPSESMPESSLPAIGEEDDAVTAPTGVLTNASYRGIPITARPTSEEMTAKEVFRQYSPSIVGVVCVTEQGQSSGSGIILSQDGYIITNSHVLNDSKTNRHLQVILHDGKKYNAVVVGFDKTTDLAVLKVNAKGLPAAVFGNSDSMEVGDWVVAIGNPGGMNFANSLTRGAISGLNRSVGYSEAGNMTYIQTDAAISPGASGGALLNLHGQVIGVNTSKLVAAGYEGMGFAIPIARAKEIVDDLVSRGFVSGRARLGIGANQVSDLQAQAQGWPRGVIIAKVDEESSFQGTKVQANDIITKVDGTAISTMAELYQKLGLHRPGEKLNMTIYRPGTLGQKGETFEVSVTLLADNGETQNPIG